MVWIKYYFSLLYIYFIPLRYVPRTYQFLLQHSSLTFDWKNEVFFRKEEYATMKIFPRTKADKFGGEEIRKINSDDNDDREGWLFRISTEETLSHMTVLLTLFSTFASSLLITTNFIRTFPISESVENYYLLFQVIFFFIRRINKHRKRSEAVKKKRVKTRWLENILCSFVSRLMQKKKKKKFTLEFLLKHNSIWRRKKNYIQQNCKISSMKKKENEKNKFNFPRDVSAKQKVEMKHTWNWMQKVFHIILERSWEK